MSNSPKNFKNVIMTTFFSLISSIDRLYLLKKGGGEWWRGGSEGCVREGRKWVVAREWGTEGEKCNFSLILVAF